MQNWNFMLLYNTFYVFSLSFRLFSMTRLESTLFFWVIYPVPFSGDSSFPVVLLLNLHNLRLFLILLKFRVEIRVRDRIKATGNEYWEETVGPHNIYFKASVLFFSMKSVIFLNISGHSFELLKDLLIFMAQIT